MTYQHILLATELANENLEIENKALQLQQAMNAKLSIINVVEYLLPSFVGVEIDMLALDLDSEKALMENAKSSIATMAERLKIAEENRILVSGRAGDEIVAAAQEIRADLIVMGSHGKHGLQLLLGSTANAVLHHAKCDVLAVRLRH